MSRFAESDRVAIRDRVDQPWQRGTVHAIHGSGYLVIRLDDTVTVDIRHPDDARVAALGDVPVDERDRLVPQRAAVRRATRVLDAHLYRRPACSCGDWNALTDPEGRCWTQHVAEQFAAAGLLAGGAR